MSKFIKDISVSTIVTVLLLLGGFNVYFEAKLDAKVDNVTLIRELNNATAVTDLKLERILLEISYVKMNMYENNK